MLKGSSKNELTTDLALGGMRVFEEKLEVLRLHRMGLASSPSS